ncbi:hypothetical protein [uncultured Pseudodesulfovibrio sp.]|uniref:hypothetical protein n=1 Tax=uncultured Pseudodesulfovibrio sp. TaxID=2035858 RepID=UPI0029C96E50|nr:hypothetical protein [uncultured Pseudodesulfovibrio sp.]
MRIGLDFDNTLIEYGHIFRELAVEWDFVPATIAEDKGAVRAHVWEHFSDIEWQKLQAAVYGPEIGRGRFMEGAADFLRLCRDKGVELVIVSHKSRYAAIDPGGTDLRQAALGWMESQGFFLPVCSGGFGFSPGEVFFESEREAKARRINALGCDIFIDDLPEVLTHPVLDPAIERILITNTPGECTGWSFAGPWPAITQHVFPDARS